MKKALPFIFPVAALLVVIFLTYRWYNQNTAQNGQISEFAEGIEIEELTDTERSSVLRGVGDYKTVELESSESDQEAEALGQVRYEVADGKVRFSVTTSMPEIEDGRYQVWLKDVDSDAVRKVFALEFAKGGYMGSAAISSETLPFEVLVTREIVDDNLPEDVLLRGTVQAEAEEAAAASATPVMEQE